MLLAILIAKDTIIDAIGQLEDRLFSSEEEIIKGEEADKLETEKM